MKNLTRFFSVVEMTKQVPRYGWTSAGLAYEETDTLAQHHFMVAMMTFLLTSDMEMKGIKIDVRRSIDMALVHDLGEVFGGDIATPLGLINPKIKQAARLIESEAITFLQTMLKNSHLKETFKALCDEERQQETDEAKVVKMIDRLEAQLYRETRYRPVKYPRGTKEYLEKAIFSIPPTMKDKKISEYCTEFATTLLTAAGKRELRNTPRERLADPQRKTTPMRHLVDLCTVLEISKQMPRYGWSFARFSQTEMDRIAEHNYVSALMTLILGLVGEEKGIKLDIRDAVQMSLIHDLSKLYGGDLPAPWRRARPQIDEAAKEIKKTTMTLLGIISGNKDIQALMENIYDKASSGKTDEAVLIRIIGQLEDHLYRELIKQPKYSKSDKKYIEKNINGLVSEFSDPKLKRFMKRFIKTMVKTVQSGELRNKSPLALIED